MEWLSNAQNIIIGGGVFGGVVGLFHVVFTFIRNSRSDTNIAWEALYGTALERCEKCEEKLEQITETLHSVTVERDDLVNQVEELTRCVSELRQSITE